MSKSTRTVWAAGGVLWRRNESDSVEVGLVHRPRYDDWTLPKGKQDPGETLIDTAVREIAEETGYTVRLGRQLQDVSYAIDHGRKHVRYWAAQAIGGSFVPNHEVDEMRWLDVEAATELLSYRIDRKILREFARLPADLRTVLLVRHARAGRKSRYKGDDRKRPLDSLGREQAQALVNVLEAFGAEVLHSADRVRCRQTLEPSRQRLGTELIEEPALSEEAYRDDPDAAHERIVQISGESSGVPAICSQGKVIPPLMSHWAERDGVELPPSRNRKGSVWVVSLDGDRMVAADHIASPLPPD